MDAHLLEVQLGWRGGIILLLLALPIVASLFLKKIPRDLLFTIAALLTAFTGVITSKQLFEAGTNQAILAILGLWLIGKAMQQQGTFHVFFSCLIASRKNRFFLFLQAILYGAFFQHRYFPLAVLQPLTRHAEKNDKAYGFPFLYLFMLGGFATTIGTPLNILLLSLYSSLLGNPFIDIFAFLPLSILPIAFSFFLLMLFEKQFRKPFSSFIHSHSSAVVLPEAPKMEKISGASAFREGKSLKASFLQSGDLLTFSKKIKKAPSTQIALFSPTISSSKGWRKVTPLIALAVALLATFFKVPTGGALLLAGLVLLLLQLLPVKRTFREEFPFPLLLEIFSAFLFFHAFQASGLNTWLASWISSYSPFFLLTLFFVTAQVLAHVMPRPIAFSCLFAVAMVLAMHPSQLLFLGVLSAFVAAVPLFGKPLTDEMAISRAMSGKAPLTFRALLLFVLFLTLVLPMSFTWPM